MWRNREFIRNTFLLKYLIEWHLHIVLLQSLESVMSNANDTKYLWRNVMYIMRLYDIKLKVS